MTDLEFAEYFRRIQLTNHPAGLAEIRSEIDRVHPTGLDADALVMMATLKKVRLTGDR